MTTDNDYTAEAIIQRIGQLRTDLANAHDIIDRLTPNIDKQVLFDLKVENTKLRQQLLRSRLLMENMSVKMLDTLLPE